MPTQIMCKIKVNIDTAIGLLRSNPGIDLYVAMWIKKDKAPRTKDDMRSDHTLNAVPSSTTWKPMKPLTSRHQNMAVVSPIYTAANHGYASWEVGMTELSRKIASSSQMPYK